MKFTGEHTNMKADTLVVGGSPSPAGISTALTVKSVYPDKSICTQIAVWLLSTVNKA